MAHSSRFLQKPSIDCEETYSPIMDATIFRCLICLKVLEGLNLRLMDVITAYLHGSLNNSIYIYIWKSLKDFKCLKQLIQNIVACTQLNYKDPCINQAIQRHVVRSLQWIFEVRSMYVLPYLSIHIHYVEYLQLL